MSETYVLSKKHFKKIPNQDKSNEYHAIGNIAKQTDGATQTDLNNQVFEIFHTTFFQQILSLKSKAAADLNHRIRLHHETDTFP